MEERTGLNEATAAGRARSLGPYGHVRVLSHLQAQRELLKGLSTEAMRSDFAGKNHSGCSMDEK